LTSLKGSQHEYGVVEIVEDRLYRLGGIARNDGRMSWATPDLDGWVPINSYLLTTSGRAMLVDTGPAAHKQQILLQLRKLISRSDPLSIFLTRAEADCIGNLDEIVRGFNVVGVFSGGRQNPFDFIDDALSHMLEAAYDEDTVEALSGRPLERKQNDEAIDLGDGRTLSVHAAPLRILTTFWLYDDETQTLFTSDFCGHNYVIGDPLVEPLASTIPDDELGDAIEHSRRHMYSKFDWMVIADKVTLRSKLTSFLEGKTVQALAPTHGRVVKGSDAVEQQIEIIGKALWGDRE
jgi:flavorubredoxin